MEMINSNEQYLFLRFILSGIVIFALFRGLWYVLPLFFRRQKFRQKVKKYIPLFETIIWILFLSWFQMRFSEKYAAFSIVLMIALFGILFWLSKFGLKDMVAGMIMRLTSEFKIGDTLRFSGQEGRLKSWTLLTLEIETAEGELLLLPYSKLMSELQVKAETKQYSSAYSFSLIPENEIDVSMTSKQISRFILDLPWSSVHQKPEVSVVIQPDKKRVFQITCFPLEKAFAKEIEKRVRDKFMGDQ